MTNLLRCRIFAVEVQKINHMATRATIVVEGQSSVKAYKHWDGYPEATLAWLQEFNHSFAKSRGDDPEYKLAQLLRSSAFDAEKYNLDASRTTGWGVVPIDADVLEEYEYFLRHDGSVDCKPVERHYD